MEFKQWFENLEQDRTQIPNIKHKIIWVKDDKNPEQINYWKKNNTHKIYKISIKNDSFIHFSLTENIPLIIEQKEISGDWSIFAVSLSYGNWFPGVQFNHIIRKKKQKLISPSDMVNKEKYLKKGYTIPNLKEEISAVLFTTNQIPKYGRIDEVVWDGPLKLTTARFIETRTAINMLKHPKYKIDSEDEVNYFL